VQRTARPGIRLVRISGHSGVRDQADPSSAFVNSGSTSTVGLAAVTAGRSDPSAQVASGLFYDAKRCKRSTRRVALTTKGLAGGAASQLQERWECPSPRQVLRGSCVRSRI
jgi:hypothetical protein